MAFVIKQKISYLSVFVLFLAAAAFFPLVGLTGDNSSVCVSAFFLEAALEAFGLAAGVSVSSS